MRNAKCMADEILAVDGREIGLQSVTDSGVAEAACGFTVFDEEGTATPGKIEQVPETAVEHGSHMLRIVFAYRAGMVIE